MNTEIFISYAREDRDTAHALADALESHGLSVWWDRELAGGEDFATKIEYQLRIAPVVLVLWSTASVLSGFVRDESTRAREQGKLLPVRIEDVQLPLGFGTLHTLDLLDWDGDADDEACARLIEQIRQRLEVARRPGSGADTSHGPGGAGPEASLTRRRRRRLLTTLGAAGVAGLAGSAGWLGWQRSQHEQGRREARERLERALQLHFAQPPQLEGAQSAYTDALALDPALARGHYFLAHLYVQLMLRGSPPPAGEVLEALRSDALQHFAAALELARAEPTRLDTSQRLVASQQLGALRLQDAAPALSRSTAPADLPASEPPAAPPPVAAARPGWTPASAPPDAPRITAAAAAAVQLPRIAAPAAAAEQARQRAEALFSRDREARLAAGAALTLDATLAAEALPTAIARARSALQQTPVDAATREGLVTAAALLRRASPSTLRGQEPALRQLLQGMAPVDDPAVREVSQALERALQRSQRERPVAYVQIAHERQRPVAEALLSRLARAGYRTPAIENTGAARAPARPEVRSQGASDPDLARWNQRVLGEVAGLPAGLALLRNARPDNDTYEIWFDAALCAPGGRTVAGCGNDP
ncbi:TIR domain-containing protein [Sphaerotilus hippei]|uniref:TIR domain-containing protein n=1 Tax=Sphaerotilus hippei TaxID=744406 RepID=A0A318HH57_9BURK|nr:toll/interleukin-1 receptor domain-containing protein [Sphaerotilus hippei]PXW99393.1 TIR domain-containing protein [Sphaerotilus hippei]